MRGDSQSTEGGGNLMDILAESQKDRGLSHRKTAGKVDVV
jgi:hypothetical protein